MGVYKIKNIIYFLMCIKCKHLAQKHEKKMVLKQKSMIMKIG